MSKPTEAQKREIKRYVEKWRPKLFLAEWFISLDYVGPDPSDEGAFDTLLSIDVAVEYMRARIRVYPAFWARDKETREEAMVHELCHCITQESSDQVSKLRDGMLVTKTEKHEANERLTQRIANIALKVQRG